MAKAGIEKDLLGTTTGGTRVDRYTLRNARGMLVRVITWGATVTELHAPDRDGRVADVVLGFDELSQYETNAPYFGCAVGRVAFRTAEGRFNLDGRTHQLTLNAGRHHLHGGARGLSHVVWSAEPLSAAVEPAVRFHCTSPDGDQGYPGNLEVAAVFTLTDGGDLVIDFTATTDRPTPVNLTHHGYFNLAGSASATILQHVLQIDADQYMPTDADMTPTGALAPVLNTPLDFRVPTPIGTRIEEAGGYDLAYSHSHPAGVLARVATVSEPNTGRVMDVLTNAPCLVLYTGNYLDGSLGGKNGTSYPRFAGFCLETGHPPDAVHHPQFPTIILRPGGTYRHTALYRFRTA